MLALVRQAWFPYLFQVIALGVVVVLIFNGWGVFPEDATVAKILRKTNTTTLIVWGLWWPGLVVLTVFLGRLWCTVCPLELITNIVRRAARRLGIVGIELPSWARVGAAVIAIYLFLQLLVAVRALHRNPGYTSWMLIGLLAFSVLVGIIFREQRAFCKGFCPAALLLDAYSRFTPVHIAPRDESVCAECKTRECIAPELKDRWDRRSCPSFLRPLERQAGDGCVLCFQCAKVCPYDNIGFGVLRPNFGPRVVRPLAVGTAIFVLIASGFVAHELFAEVKPLDAAFHWVPTQLSTGLGLGFGWAHALWFLGLLPATFACLMWLGSRLANGTARFADRLSMAALIMAPAVIAGHVTKALVKMTSWAPYVPLSFAEPRGRATAAAILSGARPEQPSLLPHTTLAVVGVFLLVLGLISALAITRVESSRGARVCGIGGVFAAAALYCFIIVSIGALAA